jgi:CheY-like chemotaxis protein
MDVIPTRLAHERRSTRGRQRADRMSTSHEKLPGGLRVDRRASGSAVSGPGFHIWDADYETALSWGRQLARGLPARRLCGSPPGRGAEPKEHSNPQTRRARALPEYRRPHVLLAEDDAGFRTLLAQVFRSRGCEVTECADGTDLMSRLGTYVLFNPRAGFDLVVSDIRMPGATALEILEAMRICQGVPPVILITAFPSEDTRDAARQLGVAAVLEKPFEIEDLVAEAEELLAKCPGERRDGNP